MQRMMLVSVILGWAVAAGVAQEKEAPVAGQVPPEIERMIRDGMAEALESRFTGGRTADELRQLGQAYVNKGRKAKQPAERTRAFDKAHEKYTKAIVALEKDAARGDAEKGIVALAALRVEFAGAIMAQQVAAELDEYELSAGQKGDRERMLKLLATARGGYEQAEAGIRPLVDDLNAREESLLTKGLYETLQQTRLDTAFNLAWANYYLGVLEPKDETRRRDALRAAEKRFQELLDAGQTGAMMYQCFLGLGMAQRELGKFPEAETSFERAMQAGVEKAVEAQVRYERARAHLKNGKFDEARAVLKPLVDKDPKNLTPEERPARFYINLALIWDANSHLLEADAVRKEAEGSPARAAILQKAQRAREAGLAKLNRLAALGGPWPALVQLYVASSVNLKTDPKTLSATELLYSGAQLADAKRFKDAIVRLQEAASRPDLEADLVCQVFFELGKAQFGADDLRGAAETFSKLAGQHKSCEQAAQAAGNAFQLWAKLAERSKAKEDYQRLADTLLNLIQSFPDHKERENAMWWLPVALQLAGRYSDAAAQFANVPESSAKWEEAQFRRALCGRQVVEQQRSTLAAADYTEQARRAAAALVRYAEQALTRAPKAGDPAAVKKWAADARISAAELLASAGVEQFTAALDTVRDFEKENPGSELVGRVLALRIRAYRGLRDFDQASKILEQYLQTVTPEEAGGTLAVLAKGMQDEVERLQADGQADAARKLATEALATFEELEKWVRGDAKRAKNVEVVVFGRAQMQYLAGQYEPASDSIDELLKASPKNGNYQRLHALIHTAQLGPDATPAQLEAAQQAWAVLLTDPAIRTRAPERYWEARCHWLGLHLRLGKADEVEKAIRQEHVWYPDLGGPPWRDKLAALYAEAATKLGLPGELPMAASRPADEAAPDAQAEEGGK